MSPINGIELIKIIRAFDCVNGTDSRGKNANIPIIVITGHAQRETIVAATKAGANGVLAKPISPATLKSRIDAVMKGAQSGQASE